MPWNTSILPYNGHIMLLFNTIDGPNTLQPTTRRTLFGKSRNKQSEEYVQSGQGMRET